MEKDSDHVSVYEDYTAPPPPTHTHVEHTHTPCRVDRFLNERTRHKCIDPARRIPDSLNGGLRLPDRAVIIISADAVRNFHPFQVPPPLHRGHHEFDLVLTNPCLGLYNSK